MTRPPFTQKILDDVGGGFVVGFTGSVLWNFGKGFWNGPNGNRLKVGYQLAKHNAPISGGGFALWGGVSAACDCALFRIRQKDDRWNALASGALAGCLLSLRGGWKTVLKSGIGGGIMVGVMEGFGLLVNRTISRQKKIAAPPLPEES